MALTLTSPDLKTEAAAALRWPVGAVSPLWFAYAGAAAVGATYFWMTRWTKATNLEAVLTLPEAVTIPSPVEPAPVTLDATPEIEQITAPLIEATSDEVEAAAEQVFELVLDSADEAVTPPTAAEPDDLTVLVGVGPKLAAALAEHGVVRFEQIAHWGEAELDAFDRLLSLKGRAVRESWVAQAKSLAAAARS
jgi:predicted flap endonuclease-1-like 5' DNA nuclease